MSKAIRRILVVLLALILAGLVGVGYEAHALYSDLSATYHFAPRISGEPRSTPVTNFFGTHRINILLLGSDNDRKFQQKYPLTQSMIVVTIDPVSDTVSMLSIPRDFWVPIPGYGMGKIDTAAGYGGVALARATVEDLLHISIDYYAWVGLKGFSHVVDDFGGVTVDVTHPILDDFYPNDLGSGNPYAYTRLFLPPGWRHLSGRQALEYVRSRHGDAIGDFGRSERQQQVLFQLENKANGLNLLLKLPGLVRDLSGMVQTDLGPNKLFDLARLARHIPLASINRVVLSAPTYCQYSTSADGQSILLPNLQAITPVVKQLFAPISVAPRTRPGTQSTPVTATAAGPTPVPTATAAASLAPAAGSGSVTPSHLPGRLLYAAGGTFYEINRHGRVTDVMPAWMSAADMPAISADGRHLAFMRWSSEASDIDVYDLRTHQTPRQITDDVSQDPTLVSNALWAAWPSWSPNGKTILFSSDRYKLQYAADESRQPDLAIYAMNADGSNVRQLTVPFGGAGGDTDPQFRGQSSEYLYDHWAYHIQDGISAGLPYSQLMIRDVNHPDAAWALTPASGQIVQPILDRSGSRLAYIDEHGTTSQLVVARLLDGKNGPELRDRRIIAAGEIAQPAFSPDGRWISYLQAAGDGFSIVIEPSSGGRTVRLNQAGTGVDALSRPIWIP